MKRGRKTATVSVVIPTLNAGTSFSVLLDSLRRQRGFGGLEIIVVDSGSTDGTAERALRMGCRLLRIPHEEFSHSYARNLGARKARGRYLLFMTQDALPDGNRWIRRLLRPLLSGKAVAVSCREVPRPDCDLLGRVSIWIHSEYMGILESDRIMTLPAERTADSLRRNAQLNDVACLVDGEVFRRFRYRGDYAEDLDLGLRLIRSGCQLALLSGVTVIHSHTRPALYHLKRSLVDVKTLTALLPEPAYTDIPAQEIADRVITAYCAALIFRKALELRARERETWEEFRAWASRAIREAVQYIRDCSKADVEKLLRADCPEPGFRGFVLELYAAYGEGYFFNLATAGEQRAFIIDTLTAYFDDSGETFGPQTGPEIRDCMLRHLARCTGSMLGVFYGYHANEDCKLNQIIRKYSRGI